VIDPDPSIRLLPPFISATVTEETVVVVAVSPFNNVRLSDPLALLVAVAPELLSILKMIVSSFWFVSFVFDVIVILAPEPDTTCPELENAPRIAVATAVVPPVTDNGAPDNTSDPSIFRELIVVCDTVTPPVNVRPESLLVAVAPATLAILTAIAWLFSSAFLVFDVIVTLAPDPDTV
jgi:hypothetical protein